jgi:NAD(P)-dependent dehydrogenase (short-subunit alcohol dehydrogenase family)
MEINVTGTFLCARSAAKIMQDQMVPGSIVMVASMSGHNVNKGVNTVPYNTSKSAVLQMSRNLAAEWGNDGVHPPIRVNTVSPGYIMTPMTVPTFESQPELQRIWPEGNMLGRMSEVSEHLASFVFLLADGSSYMTASDLRADAGHCAW